MSPACNAPERQTLQTLNTFDKSLQSQEKLDEIAQQLMKFLAYKGQAELLLNSLRNNREALQEKLTHAHLMPSSASDATGSRLYQNELAILQRGIEQITSNLQYATTTQEMAQTIKELQRSVASAHQERINHRFSLIATILTAATIFNSYLDIWSLLLDGSDWILPHPFVRFMLSSLAAIMSGFAIFFFITQRTGRGMLCVILFLLACLLAFFATLYGQPSNGLHYVLPTGIAWS